MRRHTVIGERILGSAPSLGGAAKMVRSTHERWDGKGYPDQLAGQIPLGSRIIAVCDAFDAMTSERPYAPALSARRRSTSSSAAPGRSSIRESSTHLPTCRRI